VTPPAEPAPGHLQLACLLLAQGRLAAARSALEEAARLGDPDAAAAAAWIAALPFIDADPAAAASMQRVAAGRADAALGWYQGLRENTVAELAFAGPCLLREAAIHRRAGRAQ
jgi:hypothetical protein